MMLILFCISIGLIMCYLWTEVLNLAQNYVPMIASYANYMTIGFCLVIALGCYWIYRKAKRRDIHIKSIVFGHGFLFGVIFFVYNQFQSFYSEFGTSFLNQFILLLLELIILYMLPKLLQASSLKKYSDTKTLIAIGFIDIYSTLSLFGIRLFFEHGFHLQTLMIFFLCAIWILPCIFLILYLYEIVSKKIGKTSPIKKQSPLKTWLLFWGIFIGIWILYLVALNPANMSPDSMGMWMEASSGEKIGYLNFPSIVIIFNRFLYHIIPSPAFSALIQILCYATVCATVFYELCETGLSKKCLYILAVIYAILPTNGIMVVTLWSNVPYAIFMMISAYLLLKLNREFENNQTISWSIIIGFSFVLPLVYSTRPTGFFPFCAVLLYLIACTIFYLIKTKKLVYRLLLIVAFSGLGVFLIQGPLYNHMTIQQEAKEKDAEVQVTIWMQLVDGLNSVLYHGGELPPDVEDFILSLATKEEWISLYDPYTIDYHQYPDALYAIPKTHAFTQQLTHYYLETFKAEPFILIQNRLSNSELAWNIIQPLEAENERYALTTTNELMTTPNALNIQRRPNILTSLLLVVYYGIIAVPPLDILLFRSGLYIIAILLLIVYLKKQKQFKYAACFIPLFADFCALLLSMNFPSFRVVWHIPVTYLLVCPLIIKAIQIKRTDNRQHHEDT